MDKDIIGLYLSRNSLDDYNQKKLDDDYEFMLEIADYTRDKRVYYQASEKVKNNICKQILELDVNVIKRYILNSPNYMSGPWDDLTDEEWDSAVYLLIDWVKQQNAKEMYSDMYCNYVDEIVAPEQVWDSLESEELDGAYIYADGKDWIYL